VSCTPESIGNALELNAEPTCSGGLTVSAKMEGVLASSSTLQVHI